MGPDELSNEDLEMKHYKWKAKLTKLKLGACYDIDSDDMELLEETVVEDDYAHSLFDSRRYLT